jgi:hypothetical protein
MDPAPLNRAHGTRAAAGNRWRAIAVDIAPKPNMAGLIHPAECGAEHPRRGFAKRAVPIRPALSADRPSLRRRRAGKFGGLRRHQRTVPDCWSRAAHAPASLPRSPRHHTLALSAHVSTRPRQADAPRRRRRAQDRHGSRDAFRLSRARKIRGGLPRGVRRKPVRDPAARRPTCPPPAGGIAAGGAVLRLSRHQKEATISTCALSATVAAKSECPAAGCPYLHSHAHGAA